METYKSYSFEEFNNKFKTDLKEGMALDEIMNHIENVAEISSYYASYNPRDIEETAREEEQNLNGLYLYQVDSVFFATNYTI